jgi:signal transduction histidine kinase/DNA-binding LytR/AlgR family response regulator
VTDAPWHIVLIDDNADDRAEVRHLLLRGSDRIYKFSETEYGAPGVALCRGERPPHCVVLDFNLPDMDALELLAALRGDHPMTPCPVVVLTGSSDADFARSVLRAGAQDYIGKGWMTPESMTRAVENAVERFDLQRELYAREARLRAEVGERRRTEAQLRRRERELQALADNTPDMLSRYDSGLRHVFVNATMARSTGRPPAAHIGKTLRELEMPARLVDAWEAALREVFAHRRQRELEFEVGRGDARRHFHARLIPEPGADGEVEFVLAVTTDRTVHEAAEAVLREAAQRKDEFLATLAHELRNPLAPIRTGLQLLRRVRDEQTAERVRDTIDRQLSHMVRLVDDLLDVSRISRGKFVLRRERASLQAIVELAVETSRPLVEDAHHHLRVVLPPEPVWVDADVTRIAQVVSNLLTNAAKYTPDGGSIELRVAREADQAIVRISDTGLGIPPAMLSEVFEMFAQVNRTLGRAQGGLGIGLALVKRLVEMHEGSIVAESPGNGLGSTFIVRLPAAEPEAPPGPASTPALEAPADSTLRVLVVDDNLDAAETLAMLVELAGHTTRVAHSGQEALDLAAEFTPRLIFLDIGLPILDGYAVARRLRADPRHAGLTLVALTGWGSEDDRRRTHEAGFDHHLTKPAEVSDIERILAEVVARGPAA